VKDNIDFDPFNRMVEETNMLSSIKPSLHLGKLLKPQFEKRFKDFMEGE